MARYRHTKFGHTKADNIERRTYEAEEKPGEPSFRRRLENGTKAKWMSSATKHPGATREYLARKYGNAAFNTDGSIKLSVLNQAIKQVKTSRNTKLEKKLILARTYKEM